MKQIIKRIIDCPEHGLTEVVLVDSILLRYKCSECLEELEVLDNEEV